MRATHFLIAAHGQNLIDSVRGRGGLAEHHEDAVDAHDALHHHVEVGEECEDDARFDGAAVHALRAEPDCESQPDVQAHLHERAGDRHHGAGEDVGARHGVVGGAETALFVLGLGKRLYDADARDVLAHRAHHAVEPLLHAAVERNAVPRHRQNDGQQDRDDDAKDCGQRRIHQHRGRDAAEQQDGHTRAHRLKRLHARLHVVAVARHAADETR